MTQELTGFELFQLERYGNILGTTEVMPDGECEAGEEERQRFENWCELQAERQENEDSY